jgi:hypothetical protein
LPLFPGCPDYTTWREINNISIQEENRLRDVPSYESNHPRNVKVGVAACLLNRAKTHFSQLGDRRKEQEKVKSTLRSNGYPNNIFSEVLQERRQKAVEEKKEYRGLVVIPYVAGLSEAIRRVGDTVEIKTVFSSGDTFKKRLTHVIPKGKGKEKDLVHKIPCECGAKYIGETGRTLDIRVSEHRRNWLKVGWDEQQEGDEAATSSLLAPHTVEHNHQVNWEEVTILDKEGNNRKRKIHEAAAMHIEDNVIIANPVLTYPFFGNLYKERRRVR